MSYSYIILKELRDLYRKCGEINDTELSNTIIDLNIDMNKYRIFIDGIIVRQFAFAYLKYGGIIFSRFNRIISKERILEENIIDTILKECIKIIQQVENGKINSVELKQSEAEFRKSIPKKKKELLIVLKSDIAEEITNNYLKRGKFETCNNISISNLHDIEMMIIEQIYSNYYNYAVAYPEAFGIPSRQTINQGYTLIEQLTVLKRIRNKFRQSCSYRLNKEGFDR